MCGWERSERERKEALLSVTRFGGRLLLSLKEAEEISRKTGPDEAEIAAERDKAQKETAAELDKLRAEVSTLGNNGIRLRILLLARLTDHAKELDFWRNTMAKLVLTAGGTKQDVEAINKQITDNLKTFTTRSRDAHDFDTITAVTECSSARKR